MTAATTDLSTTFAALADPVRLGILDLLASGEATVTELAAPFEISLPAISRHLKVLERAGLISRGRAAQWRPCRIESKPLQDVANWLQQYRVILDDRMDRLEDFLQTLQNEEHNDDSRQQ